MTEPSLETLKAIDTVKVYQHFVNLELYEPETRPIGKIIFSYRSDLKLPDFLSLITI